MKRFSFSLEKVHRYKDQVLDKEKNTLGQLQAQQEGLEKKIQQLCRTLNELEAQFQNQMHDGAAAMLIQYYHFQRNNMNLQVGALKEQLEQLAPILERQRQIVLDASVEVSGLDKLKEKQLEEYQKETLKAEENVISEFVILADFRQKNAI